MIRFSSFDRDRIRKRSEFAYMACSGLVANENFSEFYRKVRMHARFEWYPSLVEVRFDTVCVDVYRNEIDGTIEAICFSE